MGLQPKELASLSVSLVGVPATSDCFDWGANPYLPTVTQLQSLLRYHSGHIWLVQVFTGPTGAVRVESISLRTLGLI